MDIGDVERDEPDRHEEDADEEDDEDGEVFGIGEGERPVPVEEILPEKYVCSGNERDRGDEDTDVSRDFQWEEGERHETMESEFGELPDTIARSPMEAFVGLESDAGSLEAEPVDETAGETLGFAEAIEFVDDDPIEESEVGRIRRDMRIGDFIQRPVENLASEYLYPGVALAFLADADDDFVALLPLPDEIGDELGRVLEIGIEHHTGITGTEIDAGGRGDFLAEIP